MFKRALKQLIIKQLPKRKVILLLGARQTGKTTLLKEIASDLDDVLWINGDEYDLRERIARPTSTKLKALIGKHKSVIIDEAQRIPDIGLALKLIHDNFPDIQLIATGSSAFELINETNEPLTGRKVEYHMFPLSFGEMAEHHGELNESRLINTRLVSGYYPDVVKQENDTHEYLRFLADSYLFKDLLMLDSIKKPEKLVRLLQALAYQIGSEVSYNELASLVGIDSKTIESYIGLLEKAFIIFKLPSFSRNLRNELKQSKKIYFYDNGIRNALINDFRLLEGRQDVGPLFENFLISERMKFNHYRRHFVNTYFWRTREQQEIDYLEVGSGAIQAFEFKWNPATKPKFSKTFTRAYPEADLAMVNSENYSSFMF
ncbi:MAG: ATP-binding protein [Saprospiraceae bacterium]|nr:ATP-binding protein [Saprospiraceae bacterium]